MSRENYIEVTVDGRAVALDVDADTAITVETLDADMEAIPGLLAWYGRVLAAAIRHRDTLDDRYRAWRATRTQHELGRDGKIAEHKIKAAIEADRGFLVHRAAMAAAEELVTRLAKAHAALEVKADVLRSLGANARAELEAHGMATRGAPETAQDKDARLREQARERREGRGRTSAKSETEPSEE